VRDLQTGTFTFVDVATAKWPTFMQLKVGSMQPLSEGVQLQVGTSIPSMNAVFVS
jgi:hypothetical protein